VKIHNQAIKYAPWVRRTGSEVIDIQRYGAGENEPEVSVKIIKFMISGTEFMALASPIAKRSTMQYPAAERLQARAGACGVMRQIRFSCRF
jgi:predicted 3-demethylubiquinone-9 3-methyltransferase (glyoxalase superfamily)